jgi:cardiolipin synthase
MRTLLRLAAIATLALLGACSSFPRFVPDMALDPGPLQIEGPRGPLSPERTRQILADLRASNPDADILGRHLALEAAISDSPLVAGNHVRLLQDGPSTYRAMLAAIAGARDHINMETYIMEDDAAGKQFAAALIAKQREGVQVNLIHDSVGTIDTPEQYFKDLSDAGVNVLIFNPINPLKLRVGWDVDQRDHRKLLVVDGQTAFLGGINISGVYSGGSSVRREAASKPQSEPWRDTDLQIEGPVVAQCQRLFLSTWKQQKGRPLAARNYFPALTRQGDEVVHVIGGAPNEPYNLIFATLLSAIDSAEQEVLLTNAYFVPDPNLVASLKKAVARGVDVKVVLPSTSDSGLVSAASHSYYDELLRDGIKLYERQNALLHAKTAVIDGVWSTVGSTNLDWRSVLHNQEINAVVLGVAFGRQMHQAFDQDLAQSKQVTLENWDKRSPLQRLEESFGRLWQYWL